MTGHDKHEYMCSVCIGGEWVPCNPSSPWQQREQYNSWRAGWREMFPRATGFRAMIRRTTAAERLIHEGR